MKSPNHPERDDYVIITISYMSHMIFMQVRVHNTRNSKSDATKKSR